MADNTKNTNTKATVNALLVFAQALAKAGIKTADKAQGDKVTYTHTNRCALVKVNGKTYAEAWRRAGAVRLYIPSDSTSIQATAKAGCYSPVGNGTAEKAPTGYNDKWASTYAKIADFDKVAQAIKGIGDSIAKAQATADKPADKAQGAQAGDKATSKGKGDKAQGKAQGDKPTGDNKPADKATSKPTADKGKGDKPAQGDKVA